MGALKDYDLYAELESLPPSLTGEIINSALHAKPRPSGKHILVASNIGAEFHGLYQRGKGRPGAWWILQEPEVHLKLNREVVVPVIAGWQKARMPHMPESHKFTVVPNWICEVLSPSTESVDRNEKKPLYAKYGVSYLWLANPYTNTLETFSLALGDWECTGVYTGNDTVCVAPFVETTNFLSELLGE